MCDDELYVHNKKEGKDQESIQSSTTPDPRYQSNKPDISLINACYVLFTCPCLLLIMVC